MRSMLAGGYTGKKSYHLLRSFLTGKIYKYTINVVTSGGSLIAVLDIRFHQKKWIMERVGRLCRFRENVRLS